MLRRIGCGAALLVFAAATIFGQSQNATLDGQVTDKSGASVPSASVTITNSERAVSSSVQADNEGRAQNGPHSPAQHRHRFEEHPLSKYARDAAASEAATGVSKRRL